ncbi:PaaX family transcriptional regulator C-terminal domain-containing protein [Maritalea sp.]|jgi:phenylacetic acid degradation operon negative regulatory protein|uniref:PaaX family transcriptional regulator n=1 Tax=Maritalea sp. TaxID=2003361 RepID=UPI0039E406D0
MNASNTLIQPLIDHLHSDGRLRVWSVVITIFGDTIQPHGGTVAMSDLQTILSAMNVENGALRTAMSRLAKEGWVTRDKQGRHSFYKLSKAGLKSFIPATEKIYRATYSPDPKSLVIAVGPDVIGHAREAQNALLGAFGGLQLRNGVGFFADPSAKVLKQIEDAELLTIESDIQKLPDWVIDRFELHELAADYLALMDRFAKLAAAGSSLQTLSPLEALAARTLLIHEWRRLILKQPPLPKHLLPKNWPGAECHKVVSETYLALLARSEDWWEAEPKKAAQTELTRRFRA